MPNVAYNRPPDRAWYNPLKYLDNGWSQAPSNGGLGVGTPKIKPEDSALNQVIAPVASAVVSNLDGMSGARAVRGLVGGKPSEALSVLPSSDELGFTKPDQNTSGREIGEKIGIISPNDNLGTVKGMALDAVLNPKALAGMGRVGVGFAKTLAKPSVPNVGIAAHGIPGDAVSLGKDTAEGLARAAEKGASDVFVGPSRDELLTAGHRPGQLIQVVMRRAAQAEPSPPMDGLGMRFGQWRRQFPVYKELTTSTADKPQYRVTPLPDSLETAARQLKQVDTQAKLGNAYGYYQPADPHVGVYRQPEVRAKLFERGMRTDPKVSVPMNNTVRHEVAHGIMDRALATGTAGKLPPVMQIPTALKNAPSPFLKGIGTFLDEATAQALGSRGLRDQLRTANGFLFNPNFQGRSYYTQQIGNISPTAEWTLNQLPYAARPSTYAPAGGAALLAAIRNGGEVPANGEF